MPSDGNALGEGLYWYAEKLMWGYEDQAPDREAAVRLYRQAAQLGFSDAHIRLGEAYEHGRGVPQNAGQALASYQRAADQGNFLAYAFVAKLLTRTAHRDKADLFWDRFFIALDRDTSSEFVADSVGALVHSYISNRLHFDLPVKHLSAIRLRGTEVIAHHQRLLEHASSDEMLDRLEEVHTWMISNLDH